MSAPLPYVSTGTIEEDLGLREVVYFWRGKTHRQTLDGDSLASYTDRIDNERLRIVSAAYLILKYGNHCTIRSALCTQGEAPFEHPESADFDHINGNSKDHRLRNLRLACHSCNSHLQWKQKSVPVSSQIREREPTGTTSIETGEIPTVLRINMGNRPLYEKWLNDHTNPEVLTYDAIYEAARYLQEQNGHGSPQACRNYLKTLTAGKNPPYVIAEDHVRKRA